MSSNRQHALTALDRRARAWALYLAGRTQAEIAAELHITQGAVSKALAREERRVLDDLREMVSARKARQVAMLEHVARQALRAWEASKEPRTSKRLRTKGQGLDERHEAQVTTTHSAGDPRFLAEVRGALADERKILGLDAPTKHTIIDPDRPLEDMPDEQLDAELRELALRLGLTCVRGA